MRLFRHLLFALVASIALLALRPDASVAQTTITADWTGLGKANFSAINNGTTLNVGVNSVTINTAVVTDGDGNDANLTGSFSAGILSYYTGQVGSQTGTLFYNMDHSVFDAGDLFESTYTLDTAVTNLRFTIANVDRFLTNPFFHDAVVIEYDTGNGNWQNLRSLTSAYTLGSAVGTTTINGLQGFHGTAYSGGVTSTTGNIAVNFGALTVKRVRIRYLFGQGSPGSNPTGNWQYIGLSDFTWQQSGVSTSDLSLTKTVSDLTPASGSSISYTLRLANAGPANASNVIVNDVLPSGFSLTSSSGFGSYDPASGNWTIPTIAAGGFRQITLVGTVVAPAGISVSNIAYVQSSPNFDPDSIPGNSVASEDDYATANFTVQGTRTAGTPPVLSCPRGSSVFDWDTRSWSSGSLSNSYQVATIGTVSFDISASGTWVNDATFGGLSPSLTNTNSGGLAPTQQSLHQFLDFATVNQTATTTISFSSAIAGAQFTVFDVDFAANDFADKLTVTGSYQDAVVFPTLTNGITNYVVGNSAVGDSGASESTGDGNVVVTFSQPVDTITMIYGNANTAPADPDGQAIAIHDISMCNPFADLSVAKVSSIASDPVNGAVQPRRIPGALVDYLITISNSGVSPADDGSVVITDDGPDNAKICFDTNGSGQPLVFLDGSPSSGLELGYVALGDAGDSLAFSNDNGTSWTYVPVPDSDGCDANVTHFRLTPLGQFRAGSSFALRSSYIIR